MRCSAFRRRIVAFADGELPESLAQRMAEHAVSCRDCAAELAAVRREGEQLAAAFWRHKAPSDLAARVAAAIADREPAPTGLRALRQFGVPVRWVWAAGAVGVVLLVCLTAAYLGERSLMSRRHTKGQPAVGLMWVGGPDAPRLAGASASSRRQIYDDGFAVERERKGPSKRRPAILPVSYAANAVQQSEPSVQLEEMGRPGAATPERIKVLNERVVRPAPLTADEQTRLNAAASPPPAAAMEATAAGPPGLGGAPAVGPPRRRSLAGLSAHERPGYLDDDQPALPPVNIDSTEANVVLTVGYRQAENAYVTTYEAAFDARYAIRAPSVEREGVRIAVAFPFPNGCTAISGPKLLVNNEQDEDRTSYSIAGIRWVGWFKPKETKVIAISYTARGEGSYRYALDKNRLSKKFRFLVTVKGLEPGHQVEIPGDSLQPNPQSLTASSRPAPPAVQYLWDHDGLLTTKDIIINFPAKESPTAVAERVGANAAKLLPVVRFAPLFLILYVGALMLTGLPRTDHRYMAETLILLGLAFIAFYPLFIFLAAYVGQALALGLALGLIVILTGVYALMNGGQSLAARVAVFQCVLLGAFTYGLLDPAITGLMITLGIVILVALFMIASLRRTRLAS
jgi:hypothetical protein